MNEQCCCCCCCCRCQLQVDRYRCKISHWTTQNDALNHHIMVGRNGRYPWEESRFVGVPPNAADATPFVPSQLQLQLEAATQQQLG